MNKKLSAVLLAGLAIFGGIATTACGVDTERVVYVEDDDRYDDDRYEYDD